MSFGEKTVKSALLDVLHSFDLTDEFQLRTTFDLNNIGTGQYPVKVELYEQASNGEEHPYTKEETTINYTREHRESRLRRIPAVKKVEGQGVAIVSDSEKNLYHEIDETQKKEMKSSRDEW